MSNAKYDVLGIGNAIVDVIARSEDAFLTEHNIAKGAMTLIDADQATALYDAMGPSTEVSSGGSAANTIAGVAALGAKTAFCGKVADDQLGQVFQHDIRSLGTHFDTPALSGGDPTARCLILVTPDAQRSMSTFLGACTELMPEDVSEDLVRAANYTYLEGYLFDPPHAREAFFKAARIAHEAGRKVSLTLSDAFCVDRYREEFKFLIESEIDVLFANESEILSLYETDDFDAACKMGSKHCEITVVTRGPKGSVVISGDERYEVEAAPVEHVIDTTGAGDQYAAGFLYGLSQGLDLPTCGRIASICAAEVISHFGARPESNLQEAISELV